jgi:hypothetical protein
MTAKVPLRTDLAQCLVFIAPGVAGLLGAATGIFETYILVRLALDGAWSDFFAFLFIGSVILMTASYIVAMLISGGLLLLAGLLDRDVLRSA